MKREGGGMISRIIGRGVLILALLAAGASLAAEPKAAADPRGERVDALMRQAMADRRIPGLQIAVVKDGKIVLSRAYGQANLQTPVPVTDQTVFSINSITKAFTGVAAMREVEAGRLDLNKPVSAYLDGLPEAWRGVTIRQLLSHTSGLPDFTRMKDADTDEAGSWKAALARPVNFPAGERFDYCQTNYALIQKIINGLNGRPENATLADVQFRLASMAHTGFGDSRDVIPGKAAGYRYAFAKPSDPGELRSVYEVFSPLHRAASGMNSTADDMARWMIALQQGRLLGPPALKTMWTPVAFNNGQLGQWGMGWQVFDRPEHRMVNMTGGSRSAMFLYPDDRVGVVILTNLSGAAPEDLIDQVATLFIPGMRLTGVAALRAAFEARGYDDLPAAVAELRRQNPDFRPDEHELNDWGYRLLAFGKPAAALSVLKLTAELYPASGNAFDSLAEAYDVNGDRPRAIENYRRSLQLDPKNTNATRRLETLGASAT
jgi:CubicO group peptidase (beta-lactamase class C family)